MGTEKRKSLARPGNQNAKGNILSPAVQAAKTTIAIMDRDAMWDTVQSKDLDETIIDAVTEMLDNNQGVNQICRALGLRKQSKQWAKIMAYFRRGLRADAESYVHLKTVEFYKTIEKARVVLEDAFDKGTPMVLGGGKDEGDSIVYVKGATKELAGFIKAYSDAITLPIQLWKEFGAIGEKKEVQQGTTFVIKNNITLPSIEEIQKHQDEIVAKAKAIEVGHLGKPET